MTNRTDAIALARDILKQTLGEAYVPMHDTKLRPLSDAELGRMARTLAPKMARILLDSYNSAP